MKMISDNEHVKEIVEALKQCDIVVDWEKKRLTMNMLSVYLHSDSNIIRLLILLQRLMECKG